MLDIALVVFYRSFLRVPIVGTTHPGRMMMNGYVAKRRGRFYAVVDEGLDPVTGNEAPARAASISTPPPSTYWPVGRTSTPPSPPSRR